MATVRESRAMLLREHEELRRMVREVEESARAAASGAIVPKLGPRVRALAIAVRHHNTGEQKLLEPLLADVVALGGLLVNHLEASHNEEHAVIERAMDLASSEKLSPEDAARVVLSATRDLLDHMEDEERQLMTDVVLSDSYSTDGFCS